MLLSITPKAHYYTQAYHIGDIWRKLARYTAWVVRGGLSSWHAPPDRLFWATMERQGINL